MNSKKLKRASSLSLTTIMIISLLSGCGAKPAMGDMQMGESESDVLLVDVMSLDQGNMEMSSEFVATIAPNQSVNVLTKMNTEVLSVNVSEGDVVEAGTVLAQLDDTDAQRNLANAQVSYDNAVSNYNYSYGDAAETINQINSDSTYQTATDNVEDNQKKLTKLRTQLSEVQSDLEQELLELKQVKEDYDYDDLDDLEDTANEYYEKYINAKEEYGDNDERTVEYRERYSSTYTRYSSADTKESECQTNIDNYQDQIEDLQDEIDSYAKKVYETYGDFEDTYTKEELTNGELRNEQKNMSNNSIKSAKISVENAQDSVNDCTVTAPISGTIDAVNIEQYNTVNNGSVAFVITSKDTMKATFSVSADVRNELETGQTVEVNANGKMYEGTITVVPTAVDDATGLFEVEAMVSADGNELLSGTKVKVTTRTYHSDNTLVIPADYIYYQDGQAYVYCYEDGTAVKTNIEIGLSDDENAEVINGLTEDSVVIISWSSKLRNGISVKRSDESDKLESGQAESAPIEETDVETEVDTES